MASFVVRAIDPSIAAEVRRSLIAPGYGHPVHRELARGTGPCRACLRTFAVGEDERLLFTFDPFADGNRLSQPGPVFIHAHACRRDPGEGFPVGLRGLPVVAQSFHEDGSSPAPQPLTSGHENEELSALLASSTVRFLHLRHGEAGCFIARVERAVDHPLTTD